MIGDVQRPRSGHSRLQNGTSTTSHSEGAQFSELDLRNDANCETEALLPSFENDWYSGIERDIRQTAKRVVDRSLSRRVAMGLGRNAKTVLKG